MKTSSTEGFFKKLQLDVNNALILSDHLEIQFPTPTQIRQNIFSSLVSYVTGSNKANQRSKQKQKCFLPIPHEMFLMAYGNKLKLYRYWETQQQQHKVQVLMKLQLNYNIRKIKISPFQKYIKENRFCILIQDESSLYLELLEYDPKGKAINRIRYQKLPSQINCWSFVQNNQVWLWCRNMKLYRYEITKNGFNLLQVLETGINIQQQQIQKNSSQALSKSKSKDKAKSKSQTRYYSKSQDKNKSTAKKVTSPNLQSLKQNKIVYTLNYCEIVGRRGKQQDSVIVLFYILYNEQSNALKIKCKQILYPLQNQLQQTHDYVFRHQNNQFPDLKLLSQNHEIMSNNATNPIFLQALNITQIDDAYLIRFQFQILIIQKKFNQYFAIDSIYKKTKNCSMAIAYNSNIITCTSEKIVQLSEFTINQNKIHTVMVDFIDLQNEFKYLQPLQSDSQSREKKIKNYKNLNNQILQNYSTINELVKKCSLYFMWVTQRQINQQKKTYIYIIYETCFVKNGQEIKQYLLHITNTIPKIKKLTNLAHNIKQKQDLQSIEKLGQSLGVKSTEFYYNMWKTSEQTLDLVIPYLLKCKNYKVILSQFKGILRKKAYPTTKLYQILKKLKDLTLQILQQNLNQQNLLNYCNCVFNHRKFLIFQSNYEIDQREFSAILDATLYQYFGKIIRNKLFPQVPKPELWAVKNKEPPKMNIIQILDLFKLPLLEQYDSFLKTILLDFPQNIVAIIETFPQLLPLYPFQQYQIPMTTQVMHENQLKSTPSIKQNWFFSPIRYNDILASPDFLENVLKQLYAYYQTSLILTIFDQTMKRYEMFNQKFKFHIVISTSIQNYCAKLRNIAELKLYIIVLQTVVISNYRKKRSSEEEIEKLCQIFKINYEIPDKLLQELRVVSCFYALIGTYQIVDIQTVSLLSVYTEPIQKWIALFFLGNRQQKQLVFHQFMKIYKDRNQFVETLRKFIASQHCSKIELSLLIDLINHAGQKFQIENQAVISVIIDGFCSKIQICDTPDANHFKQRLRTIKMGQQLLIKADKIQKVGLCKRILSIFYLQNTIVKDLLERPLIILQKMLESFFMGNIKQSKVAIAQKKVLEIELKQVNNMFQLLRYLRQNVLFNITSQELVILYCKKLIEWQQFQQVNRFLYKEEYVQTYNLNTEYIVSKVQSQILQTLYENNQLYYNAETKIFITNILNLSNMSVQIGKQTQNLLILKQKAKMKIVQVFEKWGFQIRLSLLNSIIKKWQQLQQQSNRQAAFGGVFCRPIMNQIIDIYAEFLNAESLQEIYKQFMVISTGKANPNIKTDELYHYCTKLGDILMGLQKLKQTSQIICIVNERFQMNYFLMSQCMLKSLVLQKGEQSRLGSSNSPIVQFGRLGAQEKFEHKKIIEDRVLITHFSPLKLEQQSQSNPDQTSQLRTIKNYIDYFVQYWIQCDEQALQVIFSSFFSLEITSQPFQQIQVCPRLSFKQHCHKIKATFLWGLILQIFRELENNDKQKLVYTYFFFRMGLVEPEEGFQKIDYISYDHSLLIVVLNKFKQKCDTLQDLFFIDYSRIFSLYLDGLTQILVDQTQQNYDLDKNEVKNNENESHQNSRLQFKANLPVVRQLIKKGQYKTHPLSNLINKMSFLQSEAHKNMSRNIRQLKYNNYITVSKKQLSINLKMTMRGKGRRSQRINQKLNQVLPKSAEDITQKKPNDKLMMSFDQFKKMKNKIKNDKSISLIANDLDITERVIVQQIFNKNYQQKNRRYQGSRKQIPGLRQIIQSSLKQVQVKQKSQLEVSKAGTIKKQYSFGENQKSTLKNKQFYLRNDQQVLVEAIKSESYGAINNWSSDAILIESSKIYKRSDVSFPMLIKMFHELYVGDHTKIDVLWIAQPQHLKLGSNILKQIFNIEYLKKQFLTYQQYEVDILSRVYMVVDQLNAAQIQQLALYINDITKFQFKKGSRTSWLNMLINTAITKQTQRYRLNHQKIQRLDELFKLLGPQNLGKQAPNIIKLFEEDGQALLLPQIKQKIKKNIQNK